MADINMSQVAADLLAGMHHMSDKQLIEVWQKIRFELSDRRWELRTTKLNARRARIAAAQTANVERPYETRIGSKVSWEYYRTPEGAQRAANRAKIDAARLADLGYDFGYCAPGTIKPIPFGDGSMGYEVCIP